MNFKIPKRFKLFGEEIEVVFDDIYCDRESCYGIWKPNQNRIYLQKKEKGVRIEDEHIEHTFLHEVVHAICNKLNYTDLYEDERFSSQFSGMIHQFLKTAEYE